MRKPECACKPDQTARHFALQTLALSPATVPTLLTASVLLSALATSPSRHAPFVILALVAGASLTTALAHTVRAPKSNHLKATFAALPVAVSLVALPLNWAAPNLSLFVYCTLGWFMAYHAAISLRAAGSVQDEEVAALPLGTLAKSLGASAVGGALLGLACGGQITSPLAIEGLVILCYLAYGLGCRAMYLHQRRVGEQHPGGNRAIRRLDHDAACDYLSDAHRLTSRERQVFRLVARGHRPTYVAAHLAVSEATARSHIRNIYAKFDVNSYEEMLDLVHQTMDGVTVEEIAKARANPIPTQGRKRKY